MRALLIVCAVWILGASGCAPRSAVTTWEFSHWYREGGGEMGAFEDQRRACLERVGIGADPAGVHADSAAEDRYLVCMNGAGWCTDAFGCDKPGA